MLAQLTVVQLLERWRGELVEAGLTATADVVPGQPDQVAALEQRLGRSLPPTYREFLEVCGGMLVTGALTDGLRPAGRVGWFRDVEREWLEVWREIADCEDVPDPEVELMDRALVVSEPGDQALLLDPDDIDDATGGWACYTFSNFAPARIGSAPRFGPGWSTYTGTSSAVMSPPRPLLTTTSRSSNRPIRGS